MSLYTSETYRDTSSKSLEKIEESARVINVMSFVTTEGKKPMAHDFAFIVSRGRSLADLQKVKSQSVRNPGHSISKKVEQIKESKAKLTRRRNVYLSVSERREIEKIDRKLRQAEYELDLLNSCFKYW